LFILIQWHDCYCSRWFWCHRLYNSSWNESTAHTHISENKEKFIRSIKSMYMIQEYTEVIHDGTHYSTSSVTTWEVPANFWRYFVNSSFICWYLSLWVWWAWLYWALLIAQNAKTYPRENCNAISSGNLDRAWTSYRCCSSLSASTFISLVVIHWTWLA